MAVASNRIHRVDALATGVSALVAEHRAVDAFSQKWQWEGVCR